jgi:hypothetical protein
MTPLEEEGTDPPVGIRSERKKGLFIIGRI